MIFDVLWVLGHALAVVVCIKLAIADWREHRLPNRLVGALFALAIATLAVESLATSNAQMFVDAMAGAVIFGGPCLILHLISPRLMGFGDVKLAAVAGVWIGCHDALSGFAALALAFILALPESLWRMRRSANRELAFGPYLIAASIVTIIAVRA